MIEPSFITGEMSRDLGEAVALGAEAGIHRVSLRDGIFGRRVDTLTDGDVRRAGSILSEFGVRPGVLLSPFGKCDIENSVEVERHMEILARVCGLAHELETPFVRVFPFRRPGFREYEPSHLEEYLPLITERLAPAVSMAESRGITLCLEWVGSTLARTGREIAQVIEALGRPRCLGIIWEIDVARRSGEAPWEGYDHIRGLVRDIHVKPCTGPGIDPDYEWAFKALLEDCYQGTATIEHWGSRTETLRGIRQLKALLGKLEGQRDRYKVRGVRHRLR